MKTSSDPRHLKRVRLMRDLFSWNFDNQQSSSDIKDIIAKVPEIDKLIEQAATQRGVNQINKIDLSILRLGIFELIISKDAPIKVIVDEAIELAKEFGSDSSASFVNGVLGKVIEKNL